MSEWTFDKAFSYALKKIQRKDYSFKEMDQKLEKVEIPVELRAEVLEYLGDQRFIDEPRLAESVVRGQVLKKKGERVILQKIKQRGLVLEPERVRQIIDEMVLSLPVTEEELASTEQQPGDGQLELARQIVERKYPQVGTDFNEANKAFGTLVRRGFSFDIAKKVVSERRVKR